MSQEKNVDFTPFEFQLAQEEKLIDSTFALRYKVYCDECGFISPCDYPEGKETDNHDDCSSHFVIKNGDNIIGSARLILNSPKGFPVEQFCKDVNIIKKYQAAEISRFVIEFPFRRRRNDLFHTRPILLENFTIKTLLHKQKRVRPPLGLGLLREMYFYSRKNRITRWYALMERNTCALLRHHGFKFEKIGKEINYFGPVCPYMLKLDHIDTEFARRMPHYRKYFEQRWVEDLSPKETEKEKALIP